MRQEDYYIKNLATAANSSEFSEKAANKSGIFPKEGIYLGEFESVTGHKLPALISLEELRGLCFLSQNHNRILINQTIQSIILRIAASLPSGMCKIIAYDGIGLGSNLITLSNLNSGIMPDGILSNPRDLSEALHKIENHIPTIIQKTLGYRYADKTIIEYNDNGSNSPSPYYFIVITDYPQTLNKEHLESLSMILKNGKRVGVYVFMSLDTSYIEEKSNHRQLDIDYKVVMDYLTTIYEKSNRYYICNSPHDDIFHHYKLSLNNHFLETVDDIVNYINRRDIAPKVKTFDLVKYLPPEEHWWRESSESELQIPFGITSTAQPARLGITQTSGQNVAVVVGIPGSGKSVFLNVIITSASINYSPDELELYLIDFSGVEFNIYADLKLPHAKVIAPESEREFGISVLRKLKEEGSRRAQLFREAGVANITAYRKLNPGAKLPRVLVIIDEFQQLFENDMDKISEEAQSIILLIVQQYRKFGINLVLATQSINKYADKIDLGMIANRIAFEWREDDTPSLFVKRPPFDSVTTPGDCIYNNKTGKEQGNVFAKSYNVSQEELRPLLKEISAKAGKIYFENKDTIVFRSDAKAYLDSNLELKNSCKISIPDKVKIFVGEPIAISDSHVSVELQQTTNANILIIGGQNSDANLRIAINCVRSINHIHEDNSAYFYFLNYLPEEHPFKDIPSKLYSDIPFKSEFIEPRNEIEFLEKIKYEVERRENSSFVKRANIYISFYAFQYATAFRKVGEYEDISEASNLLNYILGNGPLVGVFTILQIDAYSGFKKSIDNLGAFNHRITLQMSEMDSLAIMDNYMASKLYIENKPSSKNRAYYFDKSNNTITKFKPYEIY